VAEVVGVDVEHTDVGKATVVVVEVAVSDAGLVVEGDEVSCPKYESESVGMQYGSTGFGSPTSP